MHYASRWGHLPRDHWRFYELIPVDTRGLVTQMAPLIGPGGCDTLDHHAQESCNPPVDDRRIKHRAFNKVRVADEEVWTVFWKKGRA